MRNLLALIFLLPLMAWGQSSLPACPSAALKSGCVGELVLSGGGRYVGEFQGGKRHGQGIEYFATGLVSKSGRWADGYLVQSYALDTSYFPFEAQAQTGATPAPTPAPVPSPPATLSPLPPCPASGVKHNCLGTASSASGHKYLGEFKDGKFHGQGTYTWPDGATYVGEWRDGDRNGWGTSTSAKGERFVGEYRDGKRDGQGVEYRSDGSVFRSGQWIAGKLTQSYALDPNRFAFIAASQVVPVPPLAPLPNAPPVDPARAERERLAAEAEAARRKQQELEQRLVAEARERERLAAEAEAARRKQQELEQRLVAEARERERLLAEARERELRPPPQAAQSPQPAPVARNERRVALLVGNSAYKQSPLLNAVNDAVDLNVALKALGFQTLLVQDASLATMRQKTREFADLALTADVALIFFSGHGIEHRGNNYLIPTSVVASLREFEVEDETFNAARWMDMLETQKGANRQRVNIVILDACRENTFSRGWRSTSRGLARMEAPSGTILAYATAPGKLASDGNPGDRNSPYTKNLLKAIQQPNVPVEQVFKDVRRMVVEQTRGEQVPWENSSLIGNFVFRR